MRKIISIATILCFLASNVSFAAEISPNRPSAGGTNLVKPWAIDDIVDDTPQSKKAVLAKMKLLMYLNLINELNDGRLGKVKNLKTIKEILQKKEYIVEDGDVRIGIYPHSIRHLGENSSIFLIATSVTKNGKRDDFSFLFSTVKNTEGQYPVMVCTKEHFEELKTTPQPRDDKSGRFAEKPGRSPEDALKVVALSEFLRVRVKKKGFFTIKEYNKAYKEIRKSYPALGFSELPKKRPDAQSRRDLDSLVASRILDAEKDRKGKPVKYYITTYGVEVIKERLPGIQRQVRGEIAEAPKTEKPREDIVLGPEFDIGGKDMGGKEFTGKATDIRKTGPPFSLVQRYYMMAKQICMEYGIDAGQAAGDISRIVFTAYLDEQKEELTKIDAQERKKRLIDFLEEISKKDKKQIDITYEILRKMHMTSDNPSQSIAYGLCETVRRARDGEDYADIPMAVSAPAKDLLLKKYYKIAYDILDEEQHALPKKTQKAINFAFSILELYWWSEQEKPDPNKIKESAKILEYELARADKNDINDTLDLLGKIHISSKEYVGEGVVVVESNTVIDTMLDYLKDIRDLKKLGSVKEEYREGVVVDIIVQKFSADELKQLIQAVEASEKQHEKPALTVTPLVEKLGFILEHIGIAHNIPESLPKENEIGGLRTLKGALTLKDMLARSKVKLPQDWTTKEKVTLTLPLLSVNAYKPRALLEKDLGDILVEKGVVKKGKKSHFFLRKLRKLGEKDKKRKRGISKEKFLYTSFDFNKASEFKQFKKGVFLIPCSSNIFPKDVRAQVKGLFESYYSIISFEKDGMKITVVDKDEFELFKLIDTLRKFGITGFTRDKTAREVIDTFIEQDGKQYSHKQRAAVDAIAREFSTDELNLLIRAVEASEKEDQEPALPVAIGPLLKRLALVLESTETEHNIPERLPTKDQIGGLLTLKNAFILAKASEKLPLDFPTQDGDKQPPSRRGRPRKPGRSPEDVLEVLAQLDDDTFEKILINGLTIRYYHELYNKIRESHPELRLSELPKKRPDSQTRLDFGQLVIKGYLEVRKREKGKPTVYGMTAAGLGKIEACRKEKEELALGEKPPETEEEPVEPSLQPSIDSIKEDIGEPAESPQLSLGLMQRYYSIIGKVCQKYGIRFEPETESIILTVISAYRDEQEGRLIEDKEKIKNYKKELIAHIEKTDEQTIARNIAILQKIHMPDKNPEESVVNGLLEMLNLAVDKKRYNDVILTACGPDKDCLMNKYYATARDILNLLERELADIQVSPEVIRIAYLVLDLYFFDQTVGLESAEVTEDIRKLIEKIRNVDTKDIHETLRVLKEIGLHIEAIAAEEKEYYLDDDPFIRTMLNLLDHTKDLVKLDSVKKEYRRKTAIDVLAHKFETNELIGLIHAMEGNISQSGFDKDEFIAIKRRLEFVLDYMGVQNNLPDKFPKENQIGGLWMLKAVLALKLSIEKLPENWTTKDDVTATLRPLPNNALKPVALLEKDLIDILRVNNFLGPLGRKNLTLKKLKKLGETTIKEDAEHAGRSNMLYFSKVSKFSRNVFVIPCESSVYSIDEKGKSVDAYASLPRDFYTLIYFEGDKLKVTVVNETSVRTLYALREYITKFENHPSDREVMNRYLEHEREVDALIRNAYARGAVTEIAKGEHPKASFIQLKMHSFFEAISGTINLERFIEAHPTPHYVFINVGKEENLPRIKIKPLKGEEVEVTVRAHTSWLDKTYILLTENEYNFLLLNSLQEVAWVNPNKLKKLQQNINKWILHDYFGVRMGLPIKAVSETGEPMNELDYAYAEWINEGKITPEKYPTLLIIKDGEGKIAVDLNDLRGTTLAGEGEPYERDYAAGEGTEKTETSSIEIHDDIMRKLVKEALSLVREVLDYNGFDRDKFVQAIQKVLSKRMLLDEKSAFVFSEKTTFDNGLGVLLPNLVESDIKVAVIATDDKQKKLIDELNEGKPEEEKILYAGNVAEIMVMLDMTRYYYFKVEGDPEAPFRGVVTFDITHVVKQIIDALGEAYGIVESGLLEKLHKAAHQFAQSV